MKPLTINKKLYKYIDYSILGYPKILYARSFQGAIEKINDFKPEKTKNPSFAFLGKKVLWVDSTFPELQSFSSWFGEGKIIKPGEKMAYIYLAFHRNGHDTEELWIRIKPEDLNQDLSYNEA
jgi:hypothetical protein